MTDYIENEPIMPKKRQWHEEDSPWKAEKIFNILSENRVSPKTIGEIGCGDGSVLSNLANHYDQNVTFSGYETEDEGFSLCKSREKENLRYYQQDLLKLDEYFDVVMAINVFTHVRDHLGFLSKLRLRGEYKVFYIPLQITIYYLLRSRTMQDKEYIRSHLHHFNKETALGTLQGTGYQIVNYSYVSRYVDKPDPGLRDYLWKTLYAINQDFAAKLIGGFWLMVLAK